MERDVAGGRGESAVVVTAAVALTSLAALVAGRLRQRLRLLFQQLVQGFFYAAANQFLDLALDNFLIQLYNFLGHSLLSPFEWCVVTSFYQSLQAMSSFMRFSICATYFTLSLATRGSKACATIPPASRMPQSIAATILFTKITPFRVFSADCFCFYPIDAERGILSYSFLRKYLISSFRPNIRSLPCAECPPDQAAHQG